VDVRKSYKYCLPDKEGLSSGEVRYADYSRADRADIFALPLDRETAE